MSTPDLSSVPELSFAGTVDLALLHRHNASEAFLTDTVRTGPYAFVSAARLPATHPHYGGHTGPSRHRDPLLLLECARQAETYAAHALYGVEPNARFVLRNWTAQYPAAPVSADRDELVITALTRNPRMVGERLRGMDYELDLWTGGLCLGRVRMEVGYLSDTAYTVLRTRRHGGPPPSSDDLAPTQGRAVEPERVGRLRATDTVLLDVTPGADAVTARLRVPTENPSLFDHAQDHVPAMVLMEAARQLAALATHEWTGAAPDRTELAAVTASFAAYAELTEPVELTATAAPDRSVAVAFRQAGVEVAQAAVTMAERGRGPSWHPQR